MDNDINMDNDYYHTFGATLNHLSTGLAALHKFSDFTIAARYLREFNRGIGLL
jgi:hypothetical protein